jgi:hypothetical protein
MVSRLVVGSAVLGAVLILACAHAGFVPHPTPLDVERIQPVDPGLTLEEMQAGRAVYVQRCSSCHPVHGPGEYRGDQWPGIVARMEREKKIRIPVQDRPLMERYLVAFSSTAPRPVDAGVSGVGGAGPGESAPRASR